MGLYLLIAVTLAYAWIAAESFVKKDWPMAIMFGGYAIANFGPMLVLLKR